MVGHVRRFNPSQTGEIASQAFALQGPSHPVLGIAMDMAIGLRTRPVRMDGVELCDRELVAAIREGREPNASFAQALPAMETLDRIERSLSANL